jgi:hypothetical protein
MTCSTFSSPKRALKTYLPESQFLVLFHLGFLQAGGWDVAF